MAKQGVDKETLRLIKQVILEEAEKLGVKIEKIILFGSRARGEAKPDSDYDILVVVKGELDWRTRRRLSLNIRRRLYPLLQTSTDLIIEGEERFRERAPLLGSLEEVAEKEGITA